jgi:hypothetical protein
MTATLNHDARLSPTSAEVGTEIERRPLSRTAWPWAGLVAGVAGTIGTVVLNAPVPSKEASDSGIDAVYETLDNARAVHVGAALGFLAAYALAVFTIGFARHLAQRTPEHSQLAPIAKLAMTAGIGTLIVGFGLKAAAAGGMQGGIDEDFYTKADSTVISTISGQMQYVGWQGVAIAMAVTAVAAFKYGAVARWVGVVAAIFSVFVAAFTLVLCLPYSAGLVAPPFLVLLSISLLTTRKYRQPRV